jgi:lysyl-tRNA synthetase class II
MEQLSERDVRIQKINRMKKMGVVPFAQHFDKQQSIEKIITEYGNKEMREIESIIPAPEKQVKTAGRLILYRSFGKLSF